MGPKDVIQKSIDLSDMLVNRYLNDLSDADLLVVPIEGMHPIALQLGHLIGTERWLIETIAPGSAPALPEGFTESHNIKSPPADASKFLPKDEYLKLWASQREAVKSVMSGLSDSDLDDTHDGKLPAFAPTVGEVLGMVGSHWLMHAGQFVAVRRHLKKPVAF